MKVFITGVTGFAGSHLAEHLLDSGDAVAGSSHFGSWRPNTPERLRQQVPLTGWDICLNCPESFESMVRSFSPDCIIHMAGLSIPADCGRVDPNEEARQVNSSGTEAVLRLASRIDPQIRFILASSCLVYAAVDQPSQRVNEDFPISPDNGYGKTKLAAESAVIQASLVGEIDGVVARMFQHAGPRQSSRLMLSEWAQQFATDVDPITVRSLRTTLDILDVRDAATAYRTIATQGETGSCYNVGSGQTYSGEQLFGLLCDAAGGNRKYIETAPATYNNPIADISRLTEQTGWRPEIPIEQTVRDILQFWKTAQPSDLDWETDKRSSP